MFFFATKQSKMIVFPNAKINLGLFVTEKRSDGYHNLETAFLPLPGLCDVLEVLPHSGKEDHFSSSGLVVNGTFSDNLVGKAVEILRAHTPLPPLNIHLHKKIPFGAGLGGGSADAAFMLKALNRQFGLQLSRAQLERLAVRLGADCPVFVANRPVLARGIGDQFEPLDLDLAGWHLHLVVPGIHVPTALAYSRIVPQKPKTPLKELLAKAPGHWRKLVNNDFEASVFKAHPEIAAIKEKMYHEGAIYAAMSGSGSAVYGLFRQPPALTWSANCFVHNEPLYSNRPMEG